MTLFVTTFQNKISSEIAEKPKYNAKQKWGKAEQFFWEELPKYESAHGHISQCTEFVWKEFSLIIIHCTQIYPCFMEKSIWKGSPRSEVQGPKSDDNWMTTEWRWMTAAGQMTSWTRNAERGKSKIPSCQSHFQSRGLNDHWMTIEWRRRPNDNPMTA